MKACFPKAEITLFTQKHFGEIYRDCPWVDDIIFYPAGRWRIGQAVRVLRRNRFDWALALSPTSRNSLFTLLARADVCGGYLDGFRSRATYLESHRIKKTGWGPIALLPAGAHLVDRSLAVVEAFTGRRAEDREPYLFTEQRIWERPPLSDLPKGELIAAHLFVEDEVKQWPPERFSRLFQLLAGLGEYHFVFIGGPNEKDGLEKIVAKAGLKDYTYTILTGLDLRTVAALLAKARLFVGLDSGPAHLAAAAGAKGVVLHGPTPPEFTAPVQKGVIPVYNPTSCRCDLTRCHKPPKCILSIEPEQVFSSVKAELGLT